MPRGKAVPAYYNNLGMEAWQIVGTLDREPARGVGAVADVSFGADPECTSAISAQNERVSTLPALPVTSGYVPPVVTAASWNAGRFSGIGVPRLAR
ncbi:MAG TPA: hypothetical protein VGF67_09820 [Ktedonobacteraceae bacterium]|jgi:hypothetical protein